ncbi:MAG: ABC transporter substrate-binding protein [Desulfobacteraceae bacterium]|nr:MAG: ABC transporter substrate-binding protein [Desulfobacteraceae bacterium]
MNMRKMILILVISTAVLVGGSFSSAMGESRWKMGSCWSQGNALIQPDLHFVKTVNDLCQGELKIKFHPVGEIVSAFELFGAVQEDVLEAGGDWAGYWVGKNTAFNVLSGFPMGPTVREFTSWIYQGGGFEIYNEVYGKYGLVYLPYGAASVESGVRGKKKYLELKDYKGSKIRMSGMIQGKILQDLGAVQTNLAGEELFDALDKKIVDGAEYSVPVIDWSVGLQNVATECNAPGWQQPGGVTGVMINKKEWDKLPKGVQDKLKYAAQVTMMWSVTYFDYQSGIAAQKFLDKGTNVHILDDKSLDKIEELSLGHLMEEAKKNPLFAKALYSLYQTVGELAPYRDIERPVIKRAIKSPDMKALAGAAGIEKK